MIFTTIVVVLAIATGNVAPTAGTSVDRAGATAWTNPGNILSDNATNATCAVPCDYLIACGFQGNYTIPADATIVGITVRSEWSETGTGNSSFTTQLASNNTPALIGNAKGPTTVNGTTPVITTEGSASDLWGATITQSLVESADFCVVFTSTDATNTLSIDFMTVNVEYTLPSGMFGRINAPLKGGGR